MVRASCCSLLAFTLLWCRLGGAGVRSRKEGQQRGACEGKTFAAVDQIVSLPHVFALQRRAMRTRMGI